MNSETFVYFYIYTELEISPSFILNLVYIYNMSPMNENIKLQNANEKAIIIMKPTLAYIASNIKV